MYMSFIYESVGYFLPLVTCAAIAGVGISYAYYQKMKKGEPSNSSLRKPDRNKQSPHLPMEVKLAKMSYELDEIKTVLTENIYKISGSEKDFCKRAQKKANALMDFQWGEREELISSRILRKP